MTSSGSRAVARYRPAITGVLLACCFPSVGLHALGWVALAPLFLHCASTRPRQGAVSFFVAGCVFHGLLLQWLLGNLHWAGGWAIWGYALVCVALSLFWAVFGALWCALRPHLPSLLLAPVTVALWCAMEALQNTLFTGFGWGALGYAQASNPWVLQLGAVGGVTLVSAAVVAVNALVAQAVADRRRRAGLLGAAAGVLIGAHGVGALLLEEADFDSDPLSVGLLQSAFSQGTKWDDAFATAMVEQSVDRSLELAGDIPLDLMAWPEGAVMDDPLDPEIAPLITGFLRRTNVPLLAGGARRVDGGRWANTAFLLTSDGSDPEPYDKIHLAPFGEYLPMRRYLPWIDRLVPAIGDMAAGTTPAVYDVRSRQSGRTRRIGPLICFEVLFPDMSEALRRKGAEFLVVITNLGWFGASNALEQELEQARLRAVEMRLPLVHSANTGISGVFDPWGRFTGLNAVVTPHGMFHRLHEDVHPHDTKLNRCVGSLPVAEPGKRPVPWAPERVPQAAVVATAVLAFLAALVGARRDHRPA